MERAWEGNLGESGKKSGCSLKKEIFSMTNTDKMTNRKAIINTNGEQHPTLTICKDKKARILYNTMLEIAQKYMFKFDNDDTCYFEENVQQNI